ncbi:MAG: hypothetical protein EB141_06400 [Verrucomicrobia bacterium]|nr:hypothetical protein [Verrucomicrobiota bacterium]
MSFGESTRYPSSRSAANSAACGRSCIRGTPLRRYTPSPRPDPAESCNRTITVDGLGGRLPRAGTAERPLELFVGNAGTAARFLAAMVCLGDGVYRLSGVPRMHERPQAALFAALRELGYRVDSPNDKLPAVIFGNPESRIQNPESKRCSVSVVESSPCARRRVSSPAAERQLFWRSAPGKRLRRVSTNTASALVLTISSGE